MSYPSSDASFSDLDAGSCVWDDSYDEFEFDGEDERSELTSRDGTVSEFDNRPSQSQEDDSFILMHPPFANDRRLRPFYSSLESCMRTLERFAEIHDFAVERHNLRDGSVMFTCVCFGQATDSPRDHFSSDPPILLQSSERGWQRTDCKWSQRLDRITCPGYGYEQWVFRDPAENVQHNHPPLTQFTVNMRRREELSESHSYILHLLQRQATPRTILSKLRFFNPTTPIREIDIVTIKDPGRKRAFPDAASHLEAVLRRLDAEDDLYQAFADADRLLTGLFFTSPTARLLADRFPTIIFLDTLYNTPLDGLPMLHWWGVTATGKPFTMAVMWIFKDDYRWFKAALETFDQVIGRIEAKVVITSRHEGSLIRALEDTWPHIARLVSLRHLTASVQSRCTPCFKRTDGVHGLGWREHLSFFLERWIEHVVNARTERELADGMDFMRVHYSHSEYAVAMRYIESLLSIKHLFVKLHVDRHLHLGQLDSLKHSAFLIEFETHILENPQNMLELMERVRAYLLHQHGEIVRGLVMERTARLVELPRLCDRIKDKVSRHALAMIVEQIRLAKDDLKAQKQGNSPRPCTNLFTSSTGIPCVHRLRHHVETDHPIRLMDIHYHWHLCLRDLISEDFLDDSPAMKSPRSDRRPFPRDYNHDDELGDFEPDLIADSDYTMLQVPCPPQAVIGDTGQQSRKRSMPSGDTGRRTRRREDTGISIRN